jgi:hypothetical protein
MTTCMNERLSEWGSISSHQMMAVPRAGGACRCIQSYTCYWNFDGRTTEAYLLNSYLLKTVTILLRYFSDTGRESKLSEGGWESLHVSSIDGEKKNHRWLENGHLGSAVASVCWTTIRCWTRASCWGEKSQLKDNIISQEKLSHLILKATVGGSDEILPRKRVYKL